MVDRLVLKIAAANLSDATVADELGLRLKEVFGSDEIYHLEPPRGAIVAAAIDWTVITRVADVGGIAALIWTVYEKVIRPRRRHPQDSKGLYIAIDPQVGLHWSLGKDIDDREVFVMDFSARVTQYRLSDRAGEVLEETIIDVTAGKFWVRKASNETNHEATAGEPERRADGAFVKIFISWSGNLSHKIALELRDWLPVVLPFVDPWVSSEDIPKGSRWGEELATELAATNCGLICVTPDNVEEPWLNFEAGALSKAVDRARVHPFLIGLPPGKLGGPLAQFQATRFDKDDIRRLVMALNASTDMGRVPQERIDRNFSTCWPNLVHRLTPLFAEVTSRSQEDESKRETKSRVASTDALSAEETAMLRVIVTENGEPVFPADAAESLNMRPERARHLMERLQSKGLLHPEEDALNGLSWKLSPRGREVLFESGLL